MCYDQAFKILSGLLTPLIAIITLYIAWQQYMINKRKYKLDLYEKRLQIYGEVKKILGAVMGSTTVSDINLMKFIAEFITSTSEADFLFDQEITTFIKDINSHCINLWSLNSQYLDSSQSRPEDYNHQKIVYDYHIEKEWFTNQVDTAKNLFRKYLILSR